ncbi:MAG: gliding motility-associated C-terminal domain-containing protein [Bacteroidota bacterium]
MISPLTQTICGAVPNTTLSVVSPTTGTAVWSIPTGTGSVIPGVPTTSLIGLGVGSNTIQYVVQTAAGSTCPSKTLTATVRVDPENSNPLVSPLTQTICGALPNTTLAVVSPTTGTAVWSIPTGTGSVIAGVPTTSLIGLGVGSNTIQYVVQTAAGSTCPSKTLTATVRVDPENDNPLISPLTQTICGALPNTTLTVVSPTTGTAVWSIPTGTGSVIPGVPTTSLIGLGVGSNTIQYVVQTAAGSTCPSKTLTATVKVDPENSNPLISPLTQTICGAVPNTTLSVVSPTTGTAVWSIPTGTGSVIAGVPTTSLIGLGVGSNTIQYVVQTAAGSTCPGKTITATVKVDSENSNPLISPLSQTICGLTPNATITAVTLTTGIGSWSILTGTGSVSTPSTAQTGTFTGLGVGTNTIQYMVQTAAGSSCPGKSITATVIVDPVTSIASAGSNQTICISTPTAQLAAGAFTTGIPSWSVMSGGGSVSPLTIPNATASGLALGTNTIRWLLTSVGVCPSSSSTMTIQVDQAPTPATVGSTQTLCINNPVTTLSGNAPGIGSGFWSVAAGSATFSSLNTGSSQATLALGTNILRWQTSVAGVCPVSNVSLTVKVDQLSMQAVAGSNFTICTNSNSPVLSANTPTATNTGTWTLVSGLISGFSNQFSPTSAALSMGVGVNVLQWSIKNGVCPATVSTLTIQVDDNPAASVAGVTNQTICISTGSATLGANQPGPFQGIGTWSVTFGGGTVTSINNPSTTVGNLTPTLNVFEWRISNFCGSSPVSTVSIQADLMPSTAFAGTSSAECSLASPNYTAAPVFTLGANQPTIGVGTWSVIVGSGTVSNINSSTSTFTNAGVGDNYLQWSITNGVCPPSISTVQIHIDDYANPVPAGPNQTLCISFPNTTLAATQPTAGTSFWTIFPNQPGAITNTLAANSPVNGLGLGLNTLFWNAYNGSCPPSNDFMEIYVNPAPTTASISTANQTLCVTSSVTSVSANTPVAVPGFTESGTWTFAQGSGTLANINAATTAATLNLGVNILQWSIGNGGACANSTATVQLIVAGVAGVANAGTNQTVCASSPSVTLNATAPVGVGSWSFSTGSGTITNILSPTTTVFGLATGTNILAWTLSSPCGGPSNSATVMVQVDPAPTTATAGPNQTICISSGTAMLSGNASIGATTWSLLSGNGTITNSTSPTATFTAFSTGTNIIRYTTSNGICVTTSTLSIVVNSAPSIATTAGNQSICVSSPSTTLTGNIPASGLGTWSLVSGPAVSVTTPTLGNSTVTGLTTGTTVLAWTITNPGCPPSSTNISIQVFTVTGTAVAGPNQTICVSSPTTVLAGNSPTFGIGTWSVIAGGGTLTAPGVSNTAVTSLSLGTNVLQWELTNGACSSTSSMSIQVDNAPTPATTGPTQSICITNPTTALSGNVALVGSSLWSLLSGTATILTPSLGTSGLIGLTIGTVSLKWSISNGVCATSNATLDVITYDVPGTSVAGADQTLCISSPATTLAANAPTLGVGTWSITSGSGTITAPGSYSTSVTNMSVGVNLLEWKLSNGGCFNTSSLTIQVDDLPTTSNAGSTQSICISSPTVTLGGNPPTVGTGSWSVVSGTASINNTTLATSTASNLAAGPNVLQWLITNGSCGSSSSSVTIQVDQLAQTAVVGSNQTVCASSASTTLVANTPTFGIGTWSVISGTGSIVNPTLAATTVTALATGTTVLRWQIANGGCTSSATMSVKVDAMPDIANAGPTQSLCISNPNAVLAANTITNGIGTWTLLTGTGVLSNSNSPTSAISGLSSGTNTLQWTMSNGVCSSNSATVLLIVDAPPQVSPAGINQTLCISNNSTTLAAFTPTLGTGMWSVQSGTATVTNPTLAVSTVTGLATGTNVLVWTVTNGGCSSTSTMSIQVDKMPDIAFAGPNQTLCISTPSTILAANTITTGVGTWSLVSGGGTITNSLSSVSTVTALASGANILQWTMSNGSCASNSASVTIQVDNGAGIANAGSNQTICISTGSTTVTGNAPSPGTGLWSLVSATATIVSPSSPTTQITGLTVGTHILKWTLANGTCSNSATMSITVDDVPGASNAGTNQTLCINSPGTNLAATTPSFGTAVWSVVTGGGVLSNNTSATSSVSGLSSGTNILQWTVSNGVCAPSTSSVIIQVDADPGAANAGSNQTLCISSPSVVLNGNAPAAGAGSWSVTSGSGVFTNSTSATSTVTNLGLGLNTLRWTLTNGACTNSASVTIQVDDLPDDPVAGPNQTLCISSPSTMLAANTPSGTGVGIWSVFTGTAVITNSTLATSTVTGLASGTNALQWSVSNGVCAVKTSTVLIIVDDLPSFAVAGANQTICAGGTTLSATTPTIGTGMWQVINGSAMVLTPTLAVTTVTNIASAILVLQWTNTNGVCAASASTLSIHVDDLSGSIYAGNSATVCPASYTMNAAPIVKGVGLWSVITGTATFADPTSPYTVISNLGVGKNVFRWSISNGSCPVKIDSVAITRDMPADSAYAGRDTTINTTRFQLAARQPTIGTGEWQLVSGFGAIANYQSNTTLITDLSSGENIVKWKVTGACDYTEDEIRITVVETVMPNAISPNGDGKNDYFEVPNISLYENVELTVLNRWGSVVFKTSNYDNRWNGTNMQGSPLTEDTYFYSLKMGETTLTGFIIIKR